MQPLKAISLWQPWASLWVAQWKINETRSWATSYRGPLAVHAAMFESAELKALCDQEPFKTALSALGFTTFMSLPRGCILGMCNGVECFRIVAPYGNIPGETMILKTMTPTAIPPRERAFGDFSKGRWAWEPKNMCALKAPVRCMGSQSVWTVHPEIAAQVYAQLQQP